MRKIKRPRTFKAYLPLIGLFMLLVFIMPRSPKFNYDYDKGSPWMHETLMAQFDFPVLKTEAQLLEEKDKAGSEIVPYFRHDAKALVSSRVALSSLDMRPYSSVKPVLEETLSYVYSKGILAPSAGQNVDDLKDNPSSLIYVQKDRRAVKVPVSEVFTLEEAAAYLYDGLIEAYPGINVDSLYSTVHLISVLIPDLIFDSVRYYFGR